MSWLKCNATLHTHIQSLKQNKRFSVTYFCKSHFSKSSWIIYFEFFKLAVSRDLLCFHWNECTDTLKKCFNLKIFRELLQWKIILVISSPDIIKKKIKKFLCKKARQRKPDNGSSLFADKGWHRNENYLMASPRYLYYQWPVRVNDAKFSRFLSRYLTTKQLYSYPGHCCEILSFGHCYRDQPLSSGWKCLMQSRC